MINKGGYVMCSVKDEFMSLFSEEDLVTINNYVREVSKVSTSCSNKYKQTQTLTENSKDTDLQLCSFVINEY